MQSLCQWNYCTTHGSSVLTTSFRSGEGHCRVVARANEYPTVVLEQYGIPTLLKADFNNALYLLLFEHAHVRARPHLNVRSIPLVIFLNIFRAALEKRTGARMSVTVRSVNRSLVVTKRLFSPPPPRVIYRLDYRRRIMPIGTVRNQHTLYTPNGRRRPGPVLIVSGESVSAGDLKIRSVSV